MDFLDPDVGIALTLATLNRGTYKTARVLTPEQEARRQRRREISDWNRNVANEKAAKKARKKGRA